ncbi:MAG TPA: hypothetical protein VFD49_12335 [Candidatus Dormibacteraeota bacterium]|nr:hypothetical protein [Candidatus Dormibacteraeota bacterium]
MRRSELLGRIGREARRRRVGWEFHREGGNHTVYRLGRTMIPVPRHLEIDEQLAETIFKECEVELGRRWWKR